MHNQGQNLCAPAIFCDFVKTYGKIFIEVVRAFAGPCEPRLAQLSKPQNYTHLQLRQPIYFYLDHAVV